MSFHRADLRRVRSIALALACCTLAACRDYTGSPTETPSVSLSTSTGSLTLTQGDRSAVSLTITRAGGFSGPVTITVAGAPDGVTAGVATNPVTANDATLDIVLGDAVAPGAYHLTVTAAGAGITSPGIPLTLTVSPRSPLDVAVRFCNGLEPDWVAFQDGGGAWTQAQPEASGGITSFRRTFTTNRAALATLTRFSGLTSLVITYGAPAELAARSETNQHFCPPFTTKTLTGTVAGLGANDAAFVTASFGALVRGFQGNAFDIGGIPSGPVDLFAFRNSQSNGGLAITSAIVRRGIDLPDGATMPVLDFASQEAFPPAIASVTLTGLGSDVAMLNSFISTVNGESAIFTPTTQSAAATRQYFALPEARLLAGDLQRLTTTALPSGGGTSGRGVDVYFRSPTDRTIAYGEPIAAPTFNTVASAPSLRLRAHFASQSDYDQSTGITYQQGVTQVSVLMTSAYATVSGGYDLVIPDVSAAAGFDPAWMLKAGGGPLNWNAGRIGGNVPLGLEPVLSDGMTRRTASAQGTIASP